MQAVNNICFYHDPCRSSDGWAGAMAVHTFTGGNVELIGLNYDSTIPRRDYSDTIVYFVDIMPKDINSLMLILEDCAAMHIYDHHASAQAGITKLCELAQEEGFLHRLHIVFDAERSGARIAWEELLDTAPQAVYHIDDYDRWERKYPMTDAVVAALSVKPHDVRVWEDLFNTPIMTLVSSGNSILSYQDMLVKSIALNVRTYVICNRLAPVINCPYELVDKVAEIFANKYPFVVLYCDTDKQRKYSVRSRRINPDSEINALTVAQAFGGGGHPTAAGFYTELTDPIIGRC